MINYESTDKVPWVTFADGGPSGRTLSLHRDSVCTKDHIVRGTLSLITIVGRRSKAMILEHMLGVTSIAIQQQIYLRAAYKLNPRQPNVLIADCDFSHRMNQALDNVKQPLTTTSWSVPATNNATAMFSSRILAPFASVAVYFVSDLGGPKSVAQWLAHQASFPPPSNLEVAPIVLLVVETTSDTFDESTVANRYVQRISHVLQSLGKDEFDAHKALRQHFAQITVIGLRSFMADSMRAKIFKKRLTALHESALECRRQSSLIFNSQHFFTLSKKAISHLAQNGFTTMCFADVSRPHGFSIDYFTSCLKDLLGQMPSLAWLWSVVIPLVASSLYLATYPPGSHYFSPDYIFTQIYYSHCERAIREYTENRDIQQKFVLSVSREFCNIFTKALKNELSSAHAHLQTLDSLQTHLVNFKSNRSCFCCLMRMPEKAMTCGHTFCDACIKIYGQRSCTNRNMSIHSQCLLCGVVNHESSFRFVPPTAGIRVLTLDGGGVRGVVPLIFLKHLEQCMQNFDCSVSEYFDYVCGTSAGGLVVIGMFLLRWNLSESIQQFESVSRQTFRSDRGATIFEKALEFMMAYVRDGKYSLSAIGDAFNSTFKPGKKMFNPLRNDTKVAVTTTTVNDSTPKLFTNYNGGKRPAELGYDILRAETPGSDITLSEAACCTSAAPWFFKPQHVQLGTFQDGGLQHNCPSDIADWEIRFLWPGKCVPDYALSLGTGTASYSTSTLRSNRKTYRFLTRLFKNFMRSFDSEDAWKKFFNNRPLATRDRYLRLNVRFSDHEPQLDDVTSISQLKSQAVEAICSTYNNIGKVIDMMKASMFYFELDDVPSVSDLGYEVSGFILCRQDLSTKGRQYLYETLLNTASWFIVQGSPTKCVENMPKGCPPFKCRIKFTVTNLEEKVYISIRGMTNSTSLISGFPTTVKALICHQQLDSPFGTIDHCIKEKNLPEIPQKRSIEQSRSHTKRIRRGTFF